MSYTKHNYKKGDELLASQLNEMDNQIALNEENLNKRIANVTTQAELISAIATAKIINILNDITITSEIQILQKDVQINGNGHTLAGESLSRHLLVVQNCNVVLNDLKMSNGNECVVALTASYNVTMKNCVVFNSNTASVINVKGQGTVYMDNCDIYGSTQNDGVSLIGTSKAYIKNCKIHDNFDEGLSTHNSTYCEVYDSEFYNNGYVIGTKTKGAPSSFGGCHLGGGLMGIISGCYSHDNCTYGFGLINFQADLSNDIEKCRNNLAQNNGSHGYMLTYCKNLLMTNNISIGNLGDGIHFGLDNTYTPTISGIISSGYVSGNILYSNGCDDIIVDANAYSGDLYIDAYRSGDYNNYFVDPFGELLSNGIATTTNLNFDIYKKIIMSENTFSYSDNKIKKKDGTYGNRAYGCEIINDKNKFLNNKIVLSAYVEVGNKSLTMYFRFYNSSGSAIGSDVIKGITSSGKVMLKATIPDGTATIRAWFGSQATNEWSIIAPALTTNDNYVATDDTYWKIAKTSRIPDPPVSDGTYSLKVTVSGGAATYSWV